MRQFQVEDVSSGRRALQLIMPVQAPDLFLALVSEDPSPEALLELAPSATDDFENITLGERDIMFIFTSGSSIRVRKVEAGNQSILFIGQLPTFLIEKLADRFEMKFTETPSGIYSSRFHPDNGLYSRISNDSVTKCTDLI